MSTSGSRSTGWRAYRGIALILLAFLALVLSYIRIVPPLEGFDGAAHFGYIGYLHQERALPRLDPETAVRSYELIQQPPLYYVLAAAATATLPVEQAWDYTDAMENPYHGKGLAQRQTISPPNLPHAVARTFTAARLVSALGGLLAVLCTWLLVRTLLPDAPGVALATASIVAFNPLFLFNSASITNDAWSAATVVLALWLAARTERPVDWLLVGMAGGLAGLAKYSGLLVALPGTLLFARYVHRVGWRGALPALGITLLGGVAVAGFWYGRNLSLYGELVPLEAMTFAIPTLFRPEPLPPEDIWRNIPWIFSAYWGVFVSTFMPAGYYRLVQGLMLLGAAGLLVLPWRMRGGSIPASKMLLTLCLLWFLCILASLINWMRLIVSGEQGRLLLVAAPAFAVLLLAGWMALLPRRGHPWLLRLVPVLFAGIALFSVNVIYAQYALPPEIDAAIEPQRPVDAAFVNGIGVLGVDFPEGAVVVGGQSLPLTVYLRANWPISELTTAFIHLADAEHTMLYQFDGVPVDGKHPTRQWVPGEVFADTYSLDVSPVATDTLATLSLGFYDYQETNQRVHLMADDGSTGADRIVLGTVRVLAAEDRPLTEEPPHEPLATWDNGIELLSTTVERDADGPPETLVAEWRAQRAIHTNYTVFVQVLDAQNNILAQIDQQPGGGSVPTSTWRAGEIVRDTYPLANPSTNMDGSSSTWARIIIGLYDRDGNRSTVIERTPPATNADPSYFTVLQNSSPPP